MKAKGEFQTAKELYLKALSLDENDVYSRNEIAKIDLMTYPPTEKAVEDFIIAVAEEKDRQSARKRGENYDFFGFFG